MALDTGAGPLRFLFIRNSFSQRLSNGSLPLDTFPCCIQTAERNPPTEHKFYAADEGFLGAVAVEGEAGYEDLVEIRTQ